MLKPLRLSLALCRSASQCERCSAPQRRTFRHSAYALSGHSRWSKIKHDKAKVDATKNKDRSKFSYEIALTSKLSGPDPGTNPRLADLITKAKKSGFAKHAIEVAIARGQGKSPTGGTLEALTIEAILPGNIGVVVECETDSKSRTLQQLRAVMKRHGGAASPSNYLFAKQGRVAFEGKDGLSADEALEAALEAGALDVEEDEDGGVILFTSPNETKAVGDAFGEALGLEITSSENVWVPNEDTVVPLQDSEKAVALAKFVDDLHENDSSVAGIYMTITQGGVDDATWSELLTKVNV